MSHPHGANATSKPKPAAVRGHEQKRASSLGSPARSECNRKPKTSLVEPYASRKQQPTQAWATRTVRIQSQSKSAAVQVTRENTSPTNIVCRRVKLKFEFNRQLDACVKWERSHKGGFEQIHFGRKRRDNRTTGTVGMGAGKTRSSASK